MGWLGAPKASIKQKSIWEHLVQHFKGHSQEAGVAKPLGTTLQLTKNLECVPHTDQNNGGKSNGTTLGDHKGRHRAFKWLINIYCRSYIPYESN